MQPFALLAANAQGRASLAAVISLAMLEMFNGNIETLRDLCVQGYKMYMFGRCDQVMLDQ
jgi:hypothetical protein